MATLMYSRPYTRIQAHKVEQFKATLDKNHSLHAKYSLSESSLSSSRTRSGSLQKQLFLVSVHVYMQPTCTCMCMLAHKSLHVRTSTCAAHVCTCGTHHIHVHDMCTHTHTYMCTHTYAHTHSLILIFLSPCNRHLFTSGWWFCLGSPPDWCHLSLPSHPCWDDSHWPPDHLHPRWGCLYPKPRLLHRRGL